MNKYETIIQKAKELQPKIIEWRRDFHQHPEVALKEFNTAKKVEKILQGFGIETRMMVNGTAVRGFLKGSTPGKTFALRADIDALPLQEETDVPSI